MTNDTSLQAAKEWLQSFHSLNDTLDPDTSVPEFFTADCEMQFPGHAPLQGHEEIIAFFKKQFTLLESMKHTIGQIGVLPDRVYQEATIEYVVKGDPEKKVISVAGIAIFGKGVGEDKMRSFRVYLDPMPLYGRMKEIGVVV